MAEEQQQELKEYVITKISEDGKTTQDKTSEDYTGRAQVQYPNGDVFDGFFLNGENDFRNGGGIYWALCCGTKMRRGRV